MYRAIYQNFSYPAKHRAIDNNHFYIFYTLYITVRSKKTSKEAIFSKSGHGLGMHGNFLIIAYNAYGKGLLLRVLLGSYSTDVLLRCQPAFPNGFLNR